MEETGAATRTEGWAPIRDWDDAYENTGNIPDGAAHPPRWLRLSEAALRHARIEDGIFLPEGRPRGLMVFVHGGYWMATHPGYYAHLAQGAVARGWAVVMPAYTQAPRGALAQMKVEVAAAVSAASQRVAGPVVLTGHSAGGHLAARLICADAPMAPQVTARIARVVPISGLFDLRSLRRTRMAAPLGLTPQVAQAESPALLEPVGGIAVHAWVGAAERPEFRRQSRLLSVIWHGLGVPVAVTEAPGLHHFNVIDDLAEADSPLMEAVLGGL